MAVAVVHRKKPGADGDFHTQLPGYTPPEVLLKGSPVFPLPAGEFPQPTEQALFEPPDDENPAVFADNPRSYIRCGRTALFGTTGITS